MGQTPLLSVLLLNYRNPQLTVQCALRLQHQSIADRMEILVIDNGSEDDSIGVLRTRLANLPNVHIVETPENIGFGGGNNTGARYAQGEFLLVLNPDTNPEDQGLEKLITIMKNNPDIGILAPQLVFDDGTIRESHRNFPTLPAVIAKRTPLGKMMPGVVDRYLHREQTPDALHNVDWVVGACMLMRRSLYKEVGGFDERFFLFMEDTDLCRRCWATGKRVVYCTNVQAADHKERLSGNGLWPLFTSKVGRIHIISAIKYFAKWRGTPLPAHSNSTKKTQENPTD